MGRLVDVDAVIKAVDKHTKDESEIVLDNDITCILEEVPTAYNKDAVVAELGEFQKEAMSCAVKWAYEKSINAVKRGGVE